uniref:Uncharacterized protein n=1 Tax=Candidozyma auris TaxID=498019 RepID=A0A0L0NZH2_CANAR
MRELKIWKKYQVKDCSGRLLVESLGVCEVLSVLFQKNEEEKEPGSGVVIALKYKKSLSFISPYT